jgi:hypothetical protein
MNHLQPQPDPLPRVLARQLDQAARQAVVERDDWRQALELFEQKLSIWREVGAESDDDRHELFYALHNVGEVCMRVTSLMRRRSSAGALSAPAIWETSGASTTCWR